MFPELLTIGGVTIYSYGLMIALGAIGGVAYMAREGKKVAGLTFDQANTLFLLIFIAAFAGGKFFLFFEDPSYYTANPGKLLTGRGFVFYGSFLFAVPTMLFFFRRQKLEPRVMLDVMAITTCIVHFMGRIGCFMAGCCYGIPTDSFAGIAFTHPECHARPLGTPIHPTQLYEAGYILLVMTGLLVLRSRKQFQGQLFLVYLIAYAVGRFFIETVRGDMSRGYVIEPWLTHSQLIALGVLAAVLVLYRRWRVETKRGPAGPLRR